MGSTYSRVMPAWVASIGPFSPSHPKSTKYRSCIVPHMRYTYYKAYVLQLPVRSVGTARLLMCSAIEE